ncbi:GAF domain-containing protein [Cytobacillus spongiae]|jgi:signal transduction protein with GAF and PtsI domain|uniref:GAF domain-containing protein n=1 Tax=Cytobacillus spongiae TaxID=2901381 RepID=UPI001F3AD28D|nr:GAF domain-containing protein [Cytobacillus spongiae]UII57693.1 GAF domain-containing protein [Cytobacillus spongiae]
MMENQTQYQFVIQACQQLLTEVKCDFVGLAFQHTNGPDIGWHFAVGNRNDKYKRIVVRYGKGIAGRVISTGRPMTVERFPSQILGKPNEYPIMLAEKLISSYAVPIFNQKGIPKGVLLIGQREAHLFNESQQSLVSQVANQIETFLGGLVDF